MRIHWHILSYHLLFHLFLHVSIELKVISTCSGCFMYLCGGQTNPGTIGMARSSHCSGHLIFWMELSSSTLDLLSTSQLSSLWLQLSKSVIWWRHILGAEMISGRWTMLHSTGWQSIVWIWLTFITWVHPPGRSYAAKAGRNGDLPTIQTQLHNHVQSLNMMLSRSLQYLKCILSLAFAFFEFKISSV
jgi:hypothetical protein